MTCSLLMEVVKEKVQTLLQLWEEIHQCVLMFKHLCLNVNSNRNVYNKKKGKVKAVP